MILKFAYRNLRKRLFLNLIKILGSSLSLSSILFITLFLKNELTYDSFHQKSERIYRFTVTDPFFIDGKHFAKYNNSGIIPQMVNEFPEIENFVRLFPIRGGVMKYKENYIVIKQAFQCDSSFFEVFNSKLITGNPATILDNPCEMVVSEKFAKRVFGNTNPVGQILTLPKGQFYGENTDFTIKGIMKNFPQNSHFHPEFIVSPKNESDYNWWAWIYLLLKPNASPDNISAGFRKFYASYREKPLNEIKSEAYLQKITDIHLHSHKLREIETNSNQVVVYTLFLAVLLLLFVALFNYSNLTSGMLIFTDKYIFVSKISGSSIFLRLKYFIAEGLIIIGIASFLTGIIVPFTNILIIRNYGLNLFKENLPAIVIVVLVFILLCLFFSILPLFGHLLAVNFKSLEINCFNKTGSRSINKGLTVMQYSMAITLLVALTVIYRQTSFALESGMSTKKNNVICMKYVHKSIQQKFSLFKEELLKHSSIHSVSAMFEPPGGEANDMFRFRLEGYIADESDKLSDLIGVFPCDYSFASTFNLHFLSGTNFSEKYTDNEGSGEYIINKTAMKRLNYINPKDIIGKRFELLSNVDGIEIPSGKIIGVVEDFHLSSIKKKVEPLVMFKREDVWLINFVISYQYGMETRAITDIKNVWTKLCPGYPFQYEHVNAMYENIYKNERTQAVLLSIFTFITLFINSMGLLGLSLLINQRRTKEIGIRKINGARIWDVMVMLNKNFIQLILISFVIAIPVAYFVMEKWLSNFSYRIELNWWFFVIAGLTVIGITVVTISLNSLKTANKNPVESLRYE